MDGAPLNGAYPVVVQFKARREKEQIMWRGIVFGKYFFVKFNYYCISRVFFYLSKKKISLINSVLFHEGFFGNFSRLNYLFLYFTSFYLIAKEKLRETEIVVTEDSQHRLLELMRQEVEKIKKEGNSLNKNNSPKKCPYSPNKLQSPGKKSPKKCPPSPKKFPNTSPDFLPSPDYEFFNPSNISSR